MHRGLICRAESRRRRRCRPWRVEGSVGRLARRGAGPGVAWTRGGPMATDENLGFFRTLYEHPDTDFDALRFLTEVEAQFKSDDVVQEVRWRLDALTQISNQPGLEAASSALRDKLTQIFTAGG